MITFEQFQAKVLEHYPEADPTHFDAYTSEYTGSISYSYLRYPNGIVPLYNLTQTTEDDGSNRSRWLYTNPQDLDEQGFGSTLEAAVDEAAALKVNRTDRSK